MPSPDLACRPALARISVLPIVFGQHGRRAFHDGDSAALVRFVAPVDARSINGRTLGSHAADVVLLDARGSRPSMTYRAVARLRNAGWNRGIVLLIDPDELAIVPVASAIGATDFVLSTSSPEELDVRLRRTSPRPMTAGRATEEPGSGIQLHWRTQQVSFEGTTISLTLREMQLLSVLIERGREVITSDDLGRLAWGKAGETGGGLAAAYVCSLRKKLAWFGGRFGIQTVRGVGYRFVV